MNNQIDNETARLKFKVMNVCALNNNTKQAVLSQVIGDSGDSYTLAQRIIVDGNPVYLKGTFHLNLEDLRELNAMIVSSIKEFENNLKK